MQKREHVEHYNIGEIETIDYIADKLGPEHFRAYVLGNIIKYASRALYKGQFASDIEKIRNYSVILQEHESRQGSNLTDPVKSCSIEDAGEIGYDTVIRSIEDGGMWERSGDNAFTYIWPNGRRGQESSWNTAEVNLFAPFEVVL